ncbi:MAG: transketolase family protein [Clostridia bacterium]|nr:transketolase family protein [Clostridia bacterium]
MKLKKIYNVGDKIATREAYGAALAEFGAEYDLVVFDADLSKSTKTSTFQKAFPDRFFNCGIAEGNMMAVAAGVATTGKIAFASSFAMFAAGRAFEQVRNSIGYPHLNVKIGATHAGITVGEDGATHQCNEDLGLMRTIPGMVVINPADAVEARAAVLAAIKHDGPVYLRFGRLAVPVINDEDTYEFEIGKGQVVADGDDVTIVSTGVLTAQAIIAREMLSKEGISARLVNIHTIKPIDSQLLAESAAKTGCIVTAEEHSIIGGLGSAVCESVAETCPVPVLRVGVNDVFGKSGKAVELLDEFGISAPFIAEKAKLAISAKKR